MRYVNSGVGCFFVSAFLTRQREKSVYHPSRPEAFTNLRAAATEVSAVIRFYWAAVQAMKKSYLILKSFFYFFFRFSPIRRNQIASADRANFRDRTA